jgi:hypothetical protein
MAEAYREGLLKKHYYENCPGCKVDQDKELQRGLPIRQLVSTWIVVLCTGNPTLTVCIRVFPFFWVQNFSIPFVVVLNSLFYLALSGVCFLSFVFGSRNKYITKHRTQKALQNCYN